VQDGNIGHGSFFVFSVSYDSQTSLCLFGADAFLEVAEKSLL